MAGSPWKGMWVVESTFTSKRLNVSAFTFKSPSSISVWKRFTVVYALNNDSR